jgi:hypothetical protein
MPLKIKTNFVENATQKSNDAVSMLFPNQSGFNTKEQSNHKDGKKRRHRGGKSRNQRRRDSRLKSTVELKNKENQSYFEQIHRF